MKNSIDSITNKSVQPALKAVGFKKHGLLWNRRRNCFIDVVSLQKATYSTNDSVVFTLNLGICVPAFFEAIWGRAPSQFLSEADCVVRVRLGDLIQGKPYGGATDKWWSFTDAVSEESIYDEVQDGLENKGIPFLDIFDSFAKIAEHLRHVKGWQSKNPQFIIYRALAEWKAGNNESALQLLDQVTVKAWAAKAAAAAAIVRTSAGE